MACVLFMRTHVTAYFMLLHLLLVAITHCDLPQSQRVIIVQTIAMEPGPKPVQQKFYLGGYRLFRKSYNTPVPAIMKRNPAIRNISPQPPVVDRQMLSQFTATCAGTEIQHIQKHTQSTTKTKWVDNHYNSNSMHNTIPNLKALEIKDLAARSCSMTMACGSRSTQTGPNSPTNVPA